MKLRELPVNTCWMGAPVFAGRHDDGWLGFRIVTLCRWGSSIRDCSGCSWSLRSMSRVSTLPRPLLSTLPPRVRFNSVPSSDSSSSSARAVNTGAIIPFAGTAQLLASAAFAVVRRTDSQNGSQNGVAMSRCRGVGVWQGQGVGQV